MELKQKQQKIIEEIKKNEGNRFREDERSMLLKEDAIKKLYKEMEAEQKALTEQLLRTEYFDNQTNKMTQEALKKYKEQLSRLDQDARLMQERAKRALIDGSRRAQ